MKKHDNMTNLSHEYFNSEIKEEYFSGLRETSQQSYRRIFTITSKFESMLGKDLNQFSLEEIETVLLSFKATLRTTIESYGRIMSSYLNWSVENNLSKENVLRNLRTEDFGKYVVASDSPYLSEQELRKIEDRCENYQDAVILRLIFNGVGSKELSEIRNLRKSDINFDTNQLILRDTLTTDENGIPVKYTERIMSVDDRTMYLIKGAINQTTYFKSNGDVLQTANNNIRPFSDLVDNSYVVRPSITRTDTGDSPVGKYVLYRRIKMVNDLLSENGELNAKYIQRSGMVYFTYVNTGHREVSLNDLKLLANRFNAKSYHNFKGTITSEVIKKVYPDDIK